MLQTINCIYNNKKIVIGVVETLHISDNSINIQFLNTVISGQQHKRIKSSNNNFE